MFSIRDFFNKCDQIRMRIWPHLLKKSLMENFIFCAVFRCKYSSDVSKHNIIIDINCNFTFSNLKKKNADINNENQGV